MTPKVPDKYPDAAGRTVFVCPVCRDGVVKHSDYYLCVGCEKQYPILFGIADFRIRSDRYLGLEEERDKARRIVAEANTSFSSMLDYYYSITDDVPAELAVRYKAYHYSGPAQAKHGLGSLKVEPQDTLLDVGCGTGGALVTAARSGATLFGMDIALRWLVICQQRLKEQGVNATLVCADIESPPFPDHSFSKIVATDLLENVYSVESSLASLAGLLGEKGRLWLTGSNKYCLGPHPTTRLWAIGYFPKNLRNRIVIWRRGVDSLRFIHLLSPRHIARTARKAGLQALTLSPKMIAMDAVDQYPFVDRVLIKIYARVARLPVICQLLLWFGPAFEMTFVKPGKSTTEKDVVKR